MKTIACINAVACSPYTSLPLDTGISALDRVVEYTAGLPGLERVVVLTGAEADAQLQQSDFPNQWEVRRRSDWTAESLLDELHKVGREYGGNDSVLVYYFIDAPFLDQGITRRMLAHHRRYFAEYTFADGFPDAMAPTVLNPDMPERLRGLVMPEDDPGSWDGLFTILRRDINAFEVETELSDEDYRQLRLHLRCDCRRNYLLCRGLYSQGGRDESSVLRLIKERPQLLRTVPAYSSVQVVRVCAQQVIYDPFQLVSDSAFGPLNADDDASELSPERFGALLDQLSELCGDAVVEISHWGEAGLHSRLEALAAAAVERPSIRLLLRTGGVGWPSGRLERVAEVADNSVSLIVELDADDEDTYRRIRGRGFHEAQRFVEQALALFGERCHLQAVRMNLNEEHLETYYRRWKERTPNVIIQKYDDCAGRLPARKVVDLSPLQRLPCWHLKRDVVVLIDGSVPMCKQDLDLKGRLGNAFEDGLEAVWNAGQEPYRLHLDAEYPALCRSCDEHYTFNF